MDRYLAENTPVNAPTISPPAATPASAIREIDAPALRDLLRDGRALLVDVREPDEHASECIAGSQSMPLSRFEPSALPLDNARRVVLHCKSGRRSSEAASRTIAAGRSEITQLKGGIEAWKAAGLPVERGANLPRLTIMRQVQLTIGTFVLAGTAVGALVSPWFLIVPAFMGAGLIFAGASGTCGLAALIGAMPWNRGFKQAATRYADAPALNSSKPACCANP